MLSFRFIWMLPIVLIVAACGSQPEQVVPPTLAPATPLATVPTQDIPPTYPAPPTNTPQPRRDLAAPPGTRLQVAAVGVTGYTDATITVPNDLYIAQFGVAGVVRSTIDPADDVNPEWSSDPDRLLFVSNREGTPYIYVVNVSNNNPIQRLSAFPVGEQREPSIAPDGLSIAFTSARGGADAIYRMSAIDGRGIQQLTFNPTRDYQPDWSPDNAWIAFTSERDGNPEIYMMRTDGGTPTRLTYHDGLDHSPAFSPDGRSLAFVSNRGGVEQIYIMTLPTPIKPFGEEVLGEAVDFSQPTIPPFELDTNITSEPPFITPITTGYSPKAHPTWFRTEAGGFRLVFSATLASGDQSYSQLYVTDSDGGNLAPLTEPFVSLTEPAVRPVEDF
jgi:dipeptidyl aminopeptidase/acylaminoacyl peptidase